MRCYGMDGQPITMSEWSRLCDNDERRVDSTVLPGGVWVSTVLLGIDHNFSGIGPPIIFETMVFESQDKLDELDLERYATKQEAEDGHQRMVTKWTGWMPGEPEPISDEEGEQ